MDRVVRIVPEEVVGVLTGAMDVEGTCVVECETMNVCKVENGQVTHIACDHSSHGVHPRFKDMSDRIEELVGSCKERLGIDIKAGMPKCAKCDGSGWVPMSGPSAATIMTVVKMLGIFRGIQVTPQESLKGIDARGMLESFLSSGLLGAQASRPIRAAETRQQTEEEENGPDAD